MRRMKIMMATTLVICSLNTTSMGSCWDFSKKDQIKKMQEEIKYNKEQTVVLRNEVNNLYNKGDAAKDYVKQDDLNKKIENQTNIINKQIEQNKQDTNNKLTEFSNTLKNLNAEKNTNQKNITTLQTALEDHKTQTESKLNETITSIQNLNNEISAKQTQLENKLQTMQQNCDTQYSELQTQIDSCTQELEKLQKTYTETLNKALKTFKDEESQALKKQIETAKKDLTTTFTKKITQLNDEITPQVAAVIDKNAELIKQNNKLITKNSVLTENNSQIQLKFQTAEKELQQQKKLLNKKDEELSVTKNALKEQLKATSLLSQKVDTLTESIDTVQNENKVLKTQLEKQSEKIDETIAKKIETYQTTQDKKYDDLSKRFTVLENSIIAERTQQWQQFQEAVKNTLDEFKEKLDFLEKLNTDSDVQEQINSLKAKIEELAKPKVVDLKDIGYIEQNNTEDDQDTLTDFDQSVSELQSLGYSYYGAPSNSTCSQTVSTVLYKLQHEINILGALIYTQLPDDSPYKRTKIEGGTVYRVLKLSNLKLFSVSILFPYSLSTEYPAFPGEYVFYYNAENKEIVEKLGGEKGKIFDIDPYYVFKLDAIKQKMQGEKAVEKAVKTQSDNANSQVIEEQSKSRINSVNSNISPAADITLPK